MKTYAFSPTKHFSNELYIRQECLNTLISKTSDEKKIRIWQRELDNIEIEIAEFEWYRENSTYQVLTPYHEIVESVNLKRFEKEERENEWLGYLCLLFFPLLIIALPYWIWQGYQKGR
jgi:hypothetical protein